MNEQALESRGVVIFAVGLVSVLACQLLGPVAFIMGQAYVRDCQAWGVEPSGLGQAGRILGIVSTVLLVLALVIYGLACCAGVGMALLGG
ncbi:MAG: hypothetical protein EA397_12220 [Deltaproteobacteria bacterium]|nr:MAG: hypothetical protein EA397_12220 [Deltaproteobacteria bacterium]